MVKIRNSHKRLTSEALKNRLELHVNKMDGVAAYAPHQKQVTGLRDLLPVFGAAINDAKLGGTDRTKAKNKIQMEVIQFLDGISRKVEVAANDLSQEEGETFVKNAGFELVEAKTAVSKKAVTFLDAPANFTATDIKKQGSVRFEWEDNDEADDYLFERQIKDDHWAIVGHSNTSPVIFDGFPSKANSVFRNRALRKGTLMSDCSDSVTVWVS